MIVENSKINSADGTKLFYTCWQPEDPPKAILFVVHGLGEHSGRYEEMAAFFTKTQMAVCSFDHRGHGRSEGKKGHAESIDQFVDDVEYALMHCRNLFLETPIFLYGHSMGGQIVASYLERVKSKEIAGAIISSAWFHIVTPPPSWQIKLIRRLKLILPKLTISNGISPEIISSMEAEVKIYQKDPLVHDKISLALFHSLYKNGMWLTKHAQPVNIPVLVCHGDKDQITSKSASERYANKLGKNAEFKIWPGAFHEPHHDFEKEKVMQYYVDWVKGKV